MILRFKKTNQTLIITLDGELDHHNAVNIRKQIDERFSASHTTNMILNLSKLRFMDSSGLGILIGRYKTVSSIGGKISIVKPSPPAERLISLAGIHKIIPVYQSVDAAMGGVV